jgi:signal transduction histidine kinase
VEPGTGHTDLNRIVRDTMELMGLACESQGIEPVLNLADDLPLIKADPELIKQCLINLVKNAVEAMPGGGLLTVRTGLGPAHVILEVEDTGLGIPPEIRDKVFSPFFSTKGRGSGLGLAMIKKILDDLGGTVELASVPGIGTRVTLSLPPQLAVAKPAAGG